MNPAGGYARLWRAVYGHPAFRDEAEQAAFAWMIGKAAWQPVRVRFRDKPIYLKRGQLAVSQRELAAGFRWSLGTLQRFLNRLRTESMIDTAGESGVTIITICNFDIYQAEHPGPESVGDTAAKPQPSHSRVTEQEREEDKKDSPHKPPKGQAKPKTFLPADWLPPPIDELPPQARGMAKQWPPGAYEAEAESFKLFWHSERKMKIDWLATWANRIHRAHWRVMQEARRATGRPMGEQPAWKRMREERLAKEGRA